MASSKARSSSGYEEVCITQEEFNQTKPRPLQEVSAAALQGVREEGMAPTGWLDLFTGKTWDEFLKAGGQVTGLRKPRWKPVQRMKPGY